MKTKLGNVTASSLKCVPIKWRNKPEYRLKLISGKSAPLFIVSDWQKPVLQDIFYPWGIFFYTRHFHFQFYWCIFFKVGGLEFDLLLNQDVKWETLECFLEEIYPWIFCFHEETNFLYKTSITCIILSCSVGIFNVLCNTCTMYFFYFARKFMHLIKGHMLKINFVKLFWDKMIFDDFIDF